MEKSDKVCKGVPSAFRTKCEHGRAPDKCKECGGSGLCQHGRQRSRCPKCGGGSLCPHGRSNRNECKECLQEEYAGCAVHVSHDEDTDLQGRVAVFGSKKHQIRYTNGSIKTMSTGELERALQPLGTTHCFCILSQSMGDINSFCFLSHVISVFACLQALS